jgi:hypothetical protein
VWRLGSGSAFTGLKTRRVQGADSHGKQTITDHRPTFHLRAAAFHLFPDIL